MQGRIEVITGPMFSGKSTELIKRVEKYKAEGYKVQAYKPLMDNRYAVNSIVSHNNEKTRALPVSSVDEILATLALDTEVVALDEVQFFDERVLVLANQLASSNKILIAAGLNLDFKGDPFCFLNSKRTMYELISQAGKVDVLSAVCDYVENDVKCGKHATKTQRMVNGEPAPYDSQLVLVGASEAYCARCSKHHFVPGKHEKA
ncbi:MAG: thymidine kinase [Nanoarchaeota archaeon]|nr:thymidine kinase [Nanoarchaeota archaeon]